MKHRSNEAVGDLADLLEREHAMLLAGRITDLERLTQEKTRLIDQVVTTRDHRGLVKVRKLAQRNARMLEAAGKGIQSVKQRIASLREGPKPLSTYGADGQKSTVGRTQTSLERRA